MIFLNHPTQKMKEIIFPDAFGQETGQYELYLMHMDWLSAIINIHDHLMEEAAYLFARRHIGFDWEKVSNLLARSGLGRQPVNRRNGDTSFGRNTQADKVK